MKANTPGDIFTEKLSVFARSDFFSGRQYNLKGKTVFYGGGKTRCDRSGGGEPRAIIRDTGTKGEALIDSEGVTRGAPS